MLHRCWPWQSQQENAGLNRTPKRDVNCIYHQNCLSYVLTFVYLLKTLSNSIPAHCKVVWYFLHLLVNLLIFYHEHAEGLSHPGTPGVTLPSFLRWDLSVVFHFCPWVTVSLSLQGLRLFPASASLSYPSPLSHCPALLKLLNILKKHSSCSVLLIITQRITKDIVFHQEYIFAFLLHSQRSPWISAKIKGHSGQLNGLCRFIRLRMALKVGKMCIS